MSDGLGSVRHALDSAGVAVVYNEFDPYGNPVANSPFAHSPYGYTGEWWEAEVGLLHLRARWYAPGSGIFLSRDPVDGEPPYQYVRGNPVNLTDPSGKNPCTDDNPLTICHTTAFGPKTITFPPSFCPARSKCKVEIFSVAVGGTPIGRHLFIVHTDKQGMEKTFQAYPEKGPADYIQAFLDHIEPDKNASPEDSPWGRIVVDSYPGFDRGSLQGRNTPGLRGPVILAEGENTCLLNRCLENAKMMINEANIVYWPHNQNSNAVAATLLKKCFLSRKRPFGVHPSWESEDLILPGVGK